ncbi:HAD domain-containing protein [Kribbella sp. NPDC051586]|uniref:HAD domain-containing protein n=1 Tax=Kribbella sp. NPDC051586 TaxID=3364118 RepID=UPI0037881A4C
MRPLLLLDFDGPLNPHRAREIPPGYRMHEIVEGAKVWRVLVNQQHGAELLALAEIYDLVWATSWEHGANRLLSPILGLPSDLPTILWPGRPSVADVRRGSWKTSHIADWVGGRPFAWVDDEVNRHDRFYLERLGQPHLVLRVEPHLGLTAEDFAVLRGWGRKPFVDRGCGTDT